ncbi:MAG: GGDEF domain-containing protein [Clostridiaceae bacterium]
MKNVNEYGISYYGDFTDKVLEKDFFNHEISKAIKHIRPIILALGLLFMLFIIPDYFLIKNKDTLNIILSIRTGALLLILILYYSLRRIKDYSYYAVWVTVLEVIISIAFTVIYYFYESPDYLIQAMGVIIIIIGIYLAPNKWIYMQIAAIITAAAFVAATFCIRQEIDFSEFLAGIAFILLVMILSSISSYRANYYKRVQYIDSKKLMVMSQTDSLTGLFNRAKFNDELIKWISYSDRYGMPISLAIFDFDDFKLINDKYGHLAGDKVMTDTVDDIKAVIRQSDVFARWGGDEFVLLLPNTDTQHAMELVERIRKLIESKAYQSGQHFTCSFGLVSLNNGETAEHVLQRADKLLYSAKKKGKNTIACQPYE